MPSVTKPLPRSREVERLWSRVQGWIGGCLVERAVEGIGVVSTNYEMTMSSLGKIRCC